MIGYLFLLFTIVPLVELALLVQLGQETRWWIPILLVIIDGLAGALLVRWQGWRAIGRIQDELRQGRVPTDALVDGFLVLVAGLLLITPGMLTDLVAFALLVPPLRRLIKRQVAAWLRRSVEIRSAQFAAGHGAQVWQNEPNAAPHPHAQIIDAQVIDTRVEDAS
jgi:UPF0716 protein FxsA